MIMDGGGGSNNNNDIDTNDDDNNMNIMKNTNNNKLWLCRSMEYNSTYSLIVFLIQKEEEEYE